jgi:DNA-binding response OmpR family regulator
MTVLLADDDAVSRRVVQIALERWGHAVVVAADGAAAWRHLEAREGPVLAILDWMMPGLDGLEICRRIRASRTLQGSYVLLLTARAGCEDVVLGLDSGADDFLSKPFDRRELQARLAVGDRVLSLQGALATRVTELEAALARVRSLEGLLPICAHCKRIRHESGQWEPLEELVRASAGAEFTHGICPDCLGVHA